MVAFLISVGKGDNSADDVADILASKNRALVPHMVAAEALYFLNAEFPEDIENPNISMPIDSNNVDNSSVERISSDDR